MDLAGQLKEVRTNDKMAIGLVTELVQSVPEEWRPQVAQVIRDRIRSVRVFGFGVFFVLNLSHRLRRCR